MDAKVAGPDIMYEAHWHPCEIKQAASKALQSNIHCLLCDSECSVPSLNYLERVIPQAMGILLGGELHDLDIVCTNSSHLAPP